MLLFLLFAFLAAPQGRPSPKCALSGTVVNALTGEPLAKVRVLAYGSGGGSNATPATVTDAKGHFTLVDLPAGRYEVKGQRNGFLDGAYGARHAEGSGTPIAVESGQEIKDLQLKLTPFAVIAGSIRDADGEPLSRITVTVHRLRFERGRRRLVQAGGAYTDDLGQYRIPDLAPGKYLVFAEAAKAADFGSMSRVEVITEDHSPKGSERPLALLPTLYPGVQDPSAARPVELSAGARVTGIDITLSRSRTVTVKGRASAPAGMRMSGVELNLAGVESGEPGLHMFTPVSQRDDFEFHDVPPGNYVLTASAGAPVKAFNGSMEMFPEELKARVPITVGSSPIDNVRLIMQEGAEIDGHLTVADDPKADLSGNFVSVDDGESDPDQVPIVSGNTFKSAQPLGRYTILPDLLGGDLIVRSMEVQGKDVLNGGLTISGPGKIALEITLSHDGGELAGVVLGEDGKPFAGATAVLVPQGKLAHRIDLFRTTQSDQYGRFLMEGITPGDYRLFAWQDVEAGIWWDADFLKKYETKSTPVSVAPKGKGEAKVHVGNAGGPAAGH